MTRSRAKGPFLDVVLNGGFGVLLAFVAFSALSIAVTVRLLDELGASYYAVPELSDASTWAEWNAQACGPAGYGCWWWRRKTLNHPNGCTNLNNPHIPPPKCSDIDDQTKCVEPACEWSNASSVCLQGPNQQQQGGPAPGDNPNSPPPKCSDIDDQTKCVGPLCEWSIASSVCGQGPNQQGNGTAPDGNPNSPPPNDNPNSPPPKCSDIDDQTKCVGPACEWSDADGVDSCRPTPGDNPNSPQCGGKDQSACADEGGCEFISGECRVAPSFNPSGPPPKCSDINDQTKCVGPACEWSDADGVDSCRPAPGDNPNSPRCGGKDQSACADEGGCEFISGECRVAPGPGDRRRRRRTEAVLDCTPEEPTYSFCGSAVAPASQCPLDSSGEPKNNTEGTCKLSSLTERQEKLDRCLEGSWKLKRRCVPIRDCSGVLSDYHVNAQPDPERPAQGVCRDLSEFHFVKACLNAIDMADRRRDWFVPVVVVMTATCGSWLFGLLLLLVRFHSNLQRARRAILPTSKSAPQNEPRTRLGRAAGKAKALMARMHLSATFVQKAKAVMARVDFKNRERDDSLWLVVFLTKEVAEVALQLAAVFGTPSSSTTVFIPILHVSAITINCLVTPVMLVLNRLTTALILDVGCDLTYTIAGLGALFSLFVEGSVALALFGGGSIDEGATCNTEPERLFEWLVSNFSEVTDSQLALKLFAFAFPLILLSFTMRGVWMTLINEHVKDEQNRNVNDKHASIGNANEAELIGAQSGDKTRDEETQVELGAPNPIFTHTREVELCSMSAPAAPQNASPSMVTPKDPHPSRIARVAFFASCAAIFFTGVAMVVLLSSGWRCEETGTCSRANCIPEAVPFDAPLPASVAEEAVTHMQEYISEDGRCRRSVQKNFRASVPLIEKDADGQVFMTVRFNAVDTGGDDGSGLVRDMVSEPSNPKDFIEPQFAEVAPWPANESVCEGRFRLECLEVELRLAFADLVKSGERVRYNPAKPRNERNDGQNKGENDDEQNDPPLWKLVLVEPGEASSCWTQETAWWSQLRLAGPEAEVGSRSDGTPKVGLILRGAPCKNTTLDPRTNRCVSLFQTTYDRFGKRTRPEEYGRTCAGKVMGRGGVWLAAVPEKSECGASAEEIGFEIRMSVDEMQAGGKQGGQNQGSQQNAQCRRGPNNNDQEPPPNCDGKGEAECMSDPGCEWRGEPGPPNVPPNAPCGRRPNSGEQQPPPNCDGKGEADCTSDPGCEWRGEPGPYPDAQCRPEPNSNDQEPPPNCDGKIETDCRNEPGCEWPDNPSSALPPNSTAPSTTSPSGTPTFSSSRSPSSSAPIYTPSDSSVPTMAPTLTTESPTTSGIPTTAVPTTAVPSKCAPSNSSSGTLPSISPSTSPSSEPTFSPSTSPTNASTATPTAQ